MNSDIDCLHFSDVSGDDPLADRDVMILDKSSTEPKGKVYPVSSGMIISGIEATGVLTTCIPQARASMHVRGEPSVELAIIKAR